MDFTNLDLGDFPRDKIREGLLKHIPAAQVDEVLDISCQAALQARAQIMRTISLPLDPRIQIAAFGIAWSLVQHDAAQMQEAQKEFAKSQGRTAFEVTVKG